MFQTCRPAGRLIYLVLVVALSLRVAAREDGSGSKMERSAVSAGARPTGTRAMPRAASPTPQGGPTLTSVVDTVYLADGTTAHGVLVITWPAFVEASGQTPSLPLNRDHPISSLQFSSVFFTRAMNWSATAPSMRRWS